MPSSTSLEEQQSVLIPATDSSLNVTSQITPSTTSRKRKSGHLEHDSNSTRSDFFTAKLLSTKGTISFALVTIVARACLPLAWLNPSASAPSLVCHANIPSVEEWEQRALIVRKTPNGGLFAVEQVALDTYVAWALHNWVSEAWCHDAAIGKIAEVRVEDLLWRQAEGLSRTHSRTSSESSLTALPTPKSPKRPTNRRGALARMSILNAKAAVAGQDVSESTNSSSIPQQPIHTLESPLGQQLTGGSNLPTIFQPPTVAPSLVQEPLPITPAAQLGLQTPFEINFTSNQVDELQPKPLILPITESAPHDVTADTDPLAPERLQTQYFEHLYTSKTSLAFYVKGPLSRARAHVRSAADPAKAITELSEFYEQSILSTKKVDLKYKESVSKVIMGLPVSQQGEGANAAEVKKKKSRKKKMKLGKDSLWSGEDEFIEKWWRGRELKGTVSTTDHAKEMGKELADLRMRETKMQMLLILEVMLLEMAASKLSETEKQAAATGPDIKVEPIEEELTTAILTTTPQKSPTKKRKRDWSGEMDTIVDRLSIWHTVSLDDLINTADDKLSKNAGDGSSVSKANEPLNDFCKDVLLPFYSAKLPDQVKSISRKLGGPEISPKRPKVQRPGVPTLHKSSSSTSSLSKAKQGQPFSKRTLERVLSEDHQLHRHASPPTTFSRSSSITAPIIPTLKREPSERPVSRGGMLSKSQSFSNREIDFVADQKTYEAKRRKLDRLAQQKRELEAAIVALKKPDRRAVAGQLMDEAEERKRLELEKKMAVQISATPRARRFKGQTQMEEPELPLMPRLVTQEEEAAMVVPSSSIKPRFRPGVSSSASIPQSSATKRAVLAAIHETPSRGIEKKTSNPLDLPVLSLHTAEMAYSTTIAATPAPKRTQPAAEDLPSSELNLPSSQPQPRQGANTAQSLCMTRSHRPVLFTPVKRSDVRLDHAFRDAPEIPEQAGRMMDRVMGGRGRGMAEGFEPLPNYHSMKPKGLGALGRKEVQSDGAEGDIYDKLGWNDDFDL